MYVCDTANVCGWQTFAANGMSTFAVPSPKLMEYVPALHELFSFTTAVIVVASGLDPDRGVAENAAVAALPYGRTLKTSV